MGSCVRVTGSRAVGFVFEIGFGCRKDGILTTP